MVERPSADAKKLAPLLGPINRKVLLSLLGIAPLDSPVGLASLTEEELLAQIRAKFTRHDRAPTIPIQPNPSESK